MLHSAFRTPEGAVKFLVAYDSALKYWPVPYEEIDVQTRFGTTHLLVSGPKDAPPLVLLHGYMATAIMYAPNVAAFCRDHRVYAIDTMGQPGKSVPGEPIRKADDYNTWLTETLDRLHLDRVDLIGQSFGGLLALKYAVAVPHRIKKLALLSAGGVLPLARRFQWFGMLMVMFPSQFVVNAFMRWAGSDTSRDEPVLELMHLGMTHFLMPQETVRVRLDELSDAELQGLRMPVLLLMGDREVICDPFAAMDRGRRLVPRFQGHVIPDAGHAMCSSHCEIVNALVVDFLNRGFSPAKFEESRDRQLAHA